MTAPAKSFTVVADTSIDADSPLDVTLMTALRDNDQHLEEWLGKDYTAATNHEHNGTDSAKISMANVSKTGAVGVFDDFAVAAVSGGLLLSEHAWINHNSGASIIAGDNGLVKLTGDGTATRCGIDNLPNKPFKLSGGNTLTFECKVKLDLVANYYYFGLMDADDLTGNGIIFAAEGTSAIKAKNMSGGTLTSTDTGLTWTGTTTYKLKIVATASQILFYVDDVLKATHTTNIPTAAMGVCLFIRGSVAYCTVEYVECTSSARV